MLKSFARFAALSAPEKKIAATALLLLPAMAVGLSSFGFRRLVAFANYDAGDKVSDISDHDITRMSGLVNAAGTKVPFASTCLTRSLTLQRILRRRGINSTLVIGAERADGDFEAHAWVEWGGNPVNEAPGLRERYSVLGSLSSGI